VKPDRTGAPLEVFDETVICVSLTRMKRRIRGQSAILISLIALAGVGCSKSRTPEVSTAATPQPKASVPAATSPAPGSDACTLLTKEDTQAVQGEPFTNTKASQAPVAGLTVSQCYFELPTAVNSIVLTVTRKAESAGGRDPSQSWREIFHPEHPREKKEEGEAEKEPQEVEGVGDEAFWMGSRVGGALYVLKGNSYIRISVGGAGDQAQKLEKSKTLAQAVLNRM
jgi:hypothetical protein